MSEPKLTSDVPLDDEVRTFLEGAVAGYGSMPADVLVEAALTPDAVYADHRPLSGGVVEGWEALTAQVRTTFEMLPDFRISVHVVAARGTL